MDRFINKAAHFIDQVGSSASTFSTEVWIMLSLCSVVFGYLLLRGNWGR